MSTPQRRSEGTCPVSEYLPDYAALMAAAQHTDDPATLAFAGVIALAPWRRAPYGQPIVGLDAPAMSALAAQVFPLLTKPLVLKRPDPNSAAPLDEFEHLLALLLEHRSERTARS